MPTYEYECDTCRRVFEIRQRISEPALTTCDACGGSVRRLLSAAPFILKGDGWYVSDYPSASRKKAMQAEKGASSAGASDKTAETGSATKGSTTPSDGGSSADKSPSSGSASTS